MYDDGIDGKKSVYSVRIELDKIWLVVVYNHIHEQEDVTSISQRRIWDLRERRRKKCVKVLSRARKFSLISERWIRSRQTHATSVENVYLCLSCKAPTHISSSMPITCCLLPSPHTYVLQYRPMLMRKRRPLIVRQKTPTPPSQTM